MNENKICFIYCVSDEYLFSESARYINNLYVPEGYEIEILPISGAENIAAGYNYAMSYTDAKYKVYLTENAFLLSPTFLLEILVLFQAHSNLAAIGVIGSKDVPVSGKISESDYRFGRYYSNASGTMEEHQFRKPSSIYESIVLVEGILVTQYDTGWDEGKFSTHEYTIASQCIRLLSEGLEVGVPQQKNPWLLVDSQTVDDTYSCEEDRKVFLDAYSSTLFPKVSILIPTYNRPDYFEKALRSALDQTYRHIEIVVCDDSTNNLTYEAIKPYLEAYGNIRYYKNEKNIGQFQNDLKLIELASGEYINFLMDDDLFHPEKIEKMMKYYLGDEGEEITLVTSHRSLIDEEGTQISENSLTRRLYEKDTLVDGLELGELVLKYNWNCVGEPTTVLFRKVDLTEPFGTLCGRAYSCNVDSATWLQLLTRGKAVYITETLSYFRIHADQQLASEKMRVLGAIDYANQILSAPEIGLFKDKYLDYFEGINNCLSYVNAILNSIEHSVDAYRELHRSKCDLETQKTRVINQMPLVSVLIPAYNRPHYLLLALESVLNQTYPNIEIVICDDSTNDEVMIMIQPFLKKYEQIRYYKNEVNLSGENLNKCLDLAQGEFINYLMDDDLFHKDKIEKMVLCFLKNPKVTLVTSNKQIIDENGELVNEQPPSTFNKDTIIEGKVIGNYILKNLFNLIGEPTTVMFRRRDLDGPFGSYHGRKYNFINDLATWMSLMAKGQVAYLKQTLSCFRVHAGQNQKNPIYLQHNIPDWLDLIIKSRKDGFLASDSDYKTTLIKYMKVIGGNILEDYVSFNKTYMLNQQIIDECFQTALDQIINIKGEYECPFCNNKFYSFDPLPDMYDFPSYEFEMYNKETAICPVCFSMDRERLYKVYIEKETDLTKGFSKVLHIAPERNLRTYLATFLTNNNYICGDLYPTDPFIQKMDTTQLQFPDNSFDVVLCSHVLEHIPNDIQAMKELYRVMRPDGWGILQVPIALNLEQTFEDWNVTTPEGRVQTFGQEDHVRIYGQDYVERLKTVGFLVEKYNLAKKYGMNEAKKYGLSDRDFLYIVRKSFYDDSSV